MKFARYWTRAEAESGSAGGKSFHARARGWSDDNLDAARARALDIARRVARRLASGASGSQEKYPYGQRPLPEPVIREFRGPGGDLSAIVTRNGYGSLVLNTDGLMFVDVDGRANHPASAGFGEMISSLFGKRSAAPSPAPNPVPDKMNHVAQRHGLSVRIYETAAGYRLLITNARFKPGSADAEALLRDFGSDPLYIRLCRLQESFRARLTPKPWRCHLRSLPVTFPFDTAAEQDRYRRWEAEYDSKAASYATCRYVTSLGQGTVVPEFSELIQYHDKVTKSASGVRLA
jgi:hypothetical protein